MRFRIDHTTCYTYSQPVFLEPHVVRLRPRCEASQRLERFQLEIHPAPAGLSEGLDAENNAFTLLWFDGLRDRLEITTSAEVQTLRTNPYEGLLMDGADRLARRELRPDEMALRPYLPADVPQDSSEPSGIEALVTGLMSEVEARTLDFLYRLATRLHQTIEKVERAEPGIQAPTQTLRTGAGACRDLAVLFMTACRQVGLPARFVSGYQQGDPEEPYRELHAWAEVFLPGFGWRGYDPTLGLAVADRHVAVAAAALPENAAPVEGTFRGTDATAQLQHTVTISGG